MSHGGIPGCILPEASISSVSTHQEALYGPGLREAFRFPTLRRGTIQCSSAMVQTERFSHGQISVAATGTSMPSVSMRMEKSRGRQTVCPFVPPQETNFGNNSSAMAQMGQLSHGVTSASAAILTSMPSASTPVAASCGRQMVCLSVPLPECKLFQSL